MLLITPLPFLLWHWKISAMKKSTPPMQDHYIIKKYMTKQVENLYGWRHDLNTPQTGRKQGGDNTKSLELMIYELMIQITKEEWYQTCKTQCTSTNSLVWREFCWNNQTPFFITPKINSRRRGNMEADHSHIFWNYTKILIYWQNVNAVVNNILGIWNP